MGNYNSCYECPKYHHGGAFAEIKYVPYCGRDPLPMLVKNKHARPDMMTIRCHRLKTKIKPEPSVKDKLVSDLNLMAKRASLPSDVTKLLLKTSKYLTKG